MKRLTTLIVVAATTACCSMGGAPTKTAEPTVAPTAEEIAEAEKHHKALQALEQQLEAAMLKAAAAPENAPDCTKACALTAQICGLAGKICRIAERHPQDSETRRLCQDSAPRCERARARALDTCGCE